MNETAQNIIALSLVAMCAAFVLWQSIRTLRGRGGKLGSCCAKGCTDESQEMGKKKTESNRIVFLPADSLKPRRLAEREGEAPAEPRATGGPGSAGASPSHEFVRTVYCFSSGVPVVTFSSDSSTIDRGGRTRASWRCISRRWASICRSESCAVSTCSCRASS